ncbi:cytochrome P450 [Flammeovirga kamogawensis]|uniref:Cytochrome P450 n=1 Tax=Flammeovirga kamogawensis TaxID=373891 RepID=A0ABX8GWR7_9BACT|nr:cytochrome P450 [Flammeovirga kamogawensis]MBB6461079.1 cytochrome P450 [Flammeovirga kamogawensis]QWG07647.1 cytochrome P450 [Flammeovirga kamogawensis]TRX69457.1 cytochrome P450 [Flammeovirga kamogawensis]
MELTKDVHYKQTIDDLKGPKGLPLVGNLFQLDKSKIHNQYEDWAEEFGELYSLNFLGRKVVVSTSPTNNDFILKHRPTKFRRFSKMAEVIENVGIDGVFSAEGDVWKKQRQVTQKALDSKNVKSFFPNIVLVANRLEEYWNTLIDTSQNKNHEIMNDFMRITVDITTLLAFGYDMNTINNKTDPTQEQIAKIFPKINERINTPLPFWKYIKTTSDKEFDQALAHIKSFFGDFISNTNQKIEDKPELLENPSNFLEAMLASQDKENPYTWEEIFGNLYTMLLAGEDSTSNTLSWVSYFLASKKDVQLKVQKEITDLLGENGELVSFDQLKLFKYTSAVIKEAMRMKPASPNLFMEANEDVVIGDVLFPKNSLIITQLSKSARSEDHFENSQDFLPERWMQKEAGCPFTGRHNEKALKAFGGGTRTCPGKLLAETEILVFVITMMKSFDIKLSVPEEEVIEKYAFTMSPKNLFVEITPREITYK